ncbi:DUF2877 domain-containing protein [Streptomyces sp. NPDC052225]|uniref:DUF2877 domain-containing protein n=1 Tax=Streptomyces sp. NPDC052225 TaxID=3154949 RepID=UPI003436A587
MCPDRPTSLRVTSADARLLRSLAVIAGRGRVHSVFRRVVNLRTPHGELIALGARGTGDAPRTLVTEMVDWARAGLVAEQPVTFALANITLGAPGRTLLLETAGARPWDAAAPALGHLAPAARAAAAGLLDDLNRRHGEPGGMLGASPGAGPMETAVVHALHDGRAALLAALRAGDDRGVRRGVLALLGLGPGLTPAGDDFLVGLVLVAPDRLAPVLRDVLAACPARTTDLSRATLAEAADGRARAELIDVLRRLANGRPPRELHVPVRKVLAVGHTSGSDTLSGLVAGLRLEEELRGSL